MRIAFLGYNEPTGAIPGNGVACMQSEMAAVLTQRGHEVLYYHLFSRKEYRGLNGFFVDNEIDVALWHMTTLKVRGWLKTAVPIVALWHTNPRIAFDAATFASKYNAKLVLKSAIIRKICGRLHGVFCVAMFSFVTARVSRMVLLSQRYVPHFLPAKIFRHKVLTIPNFTPNFVGENYETDKKQREVLFMGRLNNANKRVDLLLKVWQIVYKAVPDWKLIICGEGPDKDKLVEESRKLRLGGGRIYGCR